MEALLSAFPHLTEDEIYTALIENDMDVDRTATALLGGASESKEDDVRVPDEVRVEQLTSMPVSAPSVSQINAQSVYLTDTRRLRQHMFRRTWDECRKMARSRENPRTIILLFLDPENFVSNKIVQFLNTPANMEILESMYILFVVEFNPSSIPELMEWYQCTHPSILFCHPMTGSCMVKFEFPNLMILQQISPKWTPDRMNDLLMKYDHKLLPHMTELLQLVDAAGELIPS